jgi:uncharacterized membrane protein
MNTPGTAFVLFAGLAVSMPAEAGLTLCNRTSYVLYAATAAVSVPNATVKGWVRIVPGGCIEAIPGDLGEQSYFLYAKTSRAHAGAPRAWSGAVNICVKDKDFSLRLPLTQRCSGDTHTLAFAPVDTGHMRAWTTTFHDTPDLPTPTAAERAGLKRLVADTGTRGADTDKQVDAALERFKARLHLAKNAPAATLFDALETEAMKSAVPSGYTLCNDTAGDAYVAIGLQMVGLKGAVYAARGWWTVAGGTCAQLVTESVAGKKIWLRVERTKGAALVAGPTKFCVTNIEFDVQGRERCAQRGLIEAGFAETHGGPAAGFTAHVTATGLVPEGK